MDIFKSWHKPYHSSNGTGAGVWTETGDDLTWEYDKNGDIKKVTWRGEKMRWNEFIRKSGISPGAFFDEVKPSGSQPDEGIAQSPQASRQPEVAAEAGVESVAENRSMLDEVATGSVDYSLLTEGMRKDPIDPVTKERPFRENVIPLQTLLVAADEDIGKKGIDGYFGDDTEAALIKFQAKNGLAPTGEVTNETIELLKGYAKTEPEQTSDSILD